MRYLNRLVFFMMLSGCLENCLPWDFALCFLEMIKATQPDHMLFPKE